MNIGKKIKQLQESKRITISELAIELEMSHAAVYDIFKKEDVNTKILRRLSESYGVPLEYFFDESIPGSGNKISGNTTGNNIQNVSGSGHNISIDPHDCQKEVEHLTTLLKQKDKIIDLQEKLLNKK